jgi:hypothetical protein
MDAHCRERRSSAEDTQATSGSCSRAKRTYHHPDCEPNEGENGQLKDEVDVDHDSYCRHEGQSRRHEQQSLPETQAACRHLGRCEGST